MLPLNPGDVLPTGNEWVALPDLRAADGALGSFNVVSRSARGLLEVAGTRGAPLLVPFVETRGKRLRPAPWRWELVANWIPVGRAEADGLSLTLTVCAPPRSRGFLIRLEAENRGVRAIPVRLGLDAAWGVLNRVTYERVPLRGIRRTGPGKWVEDAAVHSFVTHDTIFAWCLHAPGATVTRSAARTRLIRAQTLKPGERAELLVLAGAGLEEFSACQQSRVLRGRVHRAGGADGLVAEAAAWCRARARTTGDPELDRFMNRNLLFKSHYAIDSCQTIIA